MPSRTRILVADDEALVRSAIAETLTLFGYAVSEAADGEEALRKVRAEQPDLILLDILMPKRNGMQVAVDLKDNPATRRIPIIIVTALQEMAPELMGLVEAFLPKPFRVEDLLKLVWMLAPARGAPPRPAEPLPAQLAQTGERI